jgi:hypothetical protein
MNDQKEERIWEKKITGCRTTSRRKGTRRGRKGKVKMNMDGENKCRE